MEYARELSRGLTKYSEASAPAMTKVAAALLYALTSFLIVFANKILFTQCGFPSFSFLALAQYCVTAGILWLRKTYLVAQSKRKGPGGLTGTRSNARQHPSRVQSTPGLQTVPSFSLPVQELLFPDVSWETIRAVMPLPLIFFANTVSGLGATKHLTVPMFVVLRRFSILMTMLLEMHLLSKSFSRKVQYSVALMVVSAIIAAYGDLEMDVAGYWLIFSNDLFTALQGVVLRLKLDEGQKRREAQTKRTSPDRRCVSEHTTVIPMLSDAAMKSHAPRVSLASPSIPVVRESSSGTYEEAKDSDSAGDTSPPSPNEAVALQPSGQVDSMVSTAVNRHVAMEPSLVSAAATAVAPSVGGGPNLVRQQALGPDSLMFYNALCSIPLALLLFLSQYHEVVAVASFRDWSRPLFIFWFSSSLFLGFALNYSYFLCTKVNSPLTSTVIGSMKNVLSTYIGMLVDGTYIFHPINFLGINLSVLATLIYSSEEVRRALDKPTKAVAL